MNFLSYNVFKMPRCLVISDVRALTMDHNLKLQSRRHKLTWGLSLVWKQTFTVTVALAAHWGSEQQVTDHIIDTVIYLQ